MNYTTYSRKIKKIHTLIQQESTGSPAELANHLGMPTSRLESLIGFMKDVLQAPIAYDRVRETYFYTAKGTFIMMFVKEGDLLTAD